MSVLSREVHINNGVEYFRTYFENGSIEELPKQDLSLSEFEYSNMGTDQVKIRESLVIVRNLVDEIIRRII